MSSRGRETEKRRLREQQYEEEQTEHNTRVQELNGMCTRMLLIEAFGHIETDAQVAFFTRILNHIDTLGIDTWEK